jgi:hypothetical protein
MISSLEQDDDSDSLESKSNQRFGQPRKRKPNALATGLWLDTDSIWNPRNCHSKENHLFSFGKYRD